MKFQKNWITAATCGLALVASGTTAAAQNAREKQKKEPKDIVIATSPMLVTGDMPDTQFRMAGPEGGAVFISSEFGLDGKTVKGAPFSAQTVNESIQTLGDGNRIVHRSSGSIARDSEGRVRREQTIAAIGPWASAEKQPKITFINDPVAGVNYVLNSDDKTVNKLPGFSFERIQGPGTWKEHTDGKMRDGVVIIQRSSGESADSAPKTAGEADKARDGKDMEGETFTMAIPASPPGAQFRVRRNDGNPDNAKTESLGKQSIEGVEAEGTRTTITIPAGEIGNENAILIVSERWYSPALQTVVMTKHVDPRFGETVFKLTNISRDEPARSLFELPEGYTVVNDTPFMRKFERRKEH